MTADTIFALSSGSPPAAVALVRISGPNAGAALEVLAGSVPPPRRAKLAELRNGEIVLDRALILFFPGPGSATGEDIAELHLHGGRAVVAAVTTALGRLPGLRPAEPGEFTRRAFENGRIDLAEAEGLADLLSAETETQRRAALAVAGGALSRQAEAWRQRLLMLAAALEATIDFSDEGEVGEEWPERWHEHVDRLRAEIGAFLSRPPAERLRDGIRVAIAGPPNAGKSSLLNCLVEREAAITSPVPGTTRDVIEAPVAIDGIPFLLLDTAGLRETGDEIEALGVARAEAALQTADIVLWLGDPGQAPERAVIVASKCDLERRETGDLSVSAVTGEGMAELSRLLVSSGQTLLPAEGEVSANARVRSALAAVESALRDAATAADVLIAAECLRHALTHVDRVTGRAGVEEMLDSLFGRFCIGK